MTFTSISGAMGTGGSGASAFSGAATGTSATARFGTGGGQTTRNTPAPMAKLTSPVAMTPFWRVGFTNDRANSGNQAYDDDTGGFAGSTGGICLTLGGVGGSGFMLGIVGARANIGACTGVVGFGNGGSKLEPYDGSASGFIAGSTGSEMGSKPSVLRSLIREHLLLTLRSDRPVSVLKNRTGVTALCRTECLVQRS